MMLQKKSRADIHTQYMMKQAYIYTFEVKDAPELIDQKIFP